LVNWKEPALTAKLVSAAVLVISASYYTHATSCLQFIAPDKVLLVEDDLVMTVDQSLYWKDKPVVLRSRGRAPALWQWRLLIALVDRKNTLVSNKELAADVWPDEFPLAPDVLARRIPDEVNRLRQAFMRVDNNFKVLVTRPGYGHAWDTEGRWKERIARAPRGGQDFFWNGGFVHLTDRRARMVDLLMETTDIVDNRRLYEAYLGKPMQPGAASDDEISNNVRVQMSKIRRAFRVVDPLFDHIRTVPGLGYVWHN
jgi:DNA-binding winged helix-turn-helix (wHTH) protein